MQFTERAIQDSHAGRSWCHHFPWTHQIYSYIETNSLYKRPEELETSWTNDKRTMLRQVGETEMECCQNPHLWDADPQLGRISQLWSFSLRSKALYLHQASQPLGSIPERWELPPHPRQNVWLWKTMGFISRRSKRLREQKLYCQRVCMQTHREK